MSVCLSASARVVASTSNATTLTDVYFIPSYVRPQTPRFEGAGEALKRIDRKITDKEKLNAARITLDDYLSRSKEDPKDKPVLAVSGLSDGGTFRILKGGSAEVIF